MAVYINTHTLTSALVEYFYSHRLINSVSVANEIDFRAIASKDYPTANVEPLEASYDGNLVSQGYLITIADIMDTEFVGENNFRLQSAMQSIASDTILYLQNQTDFDASTIVTVNVFEDEGTDRTAGVVFRINLVYFRDSNICLFDNILSITKPFCVDLVDREVRFRLWLMHPFVEDYEVTFDGGDSWTTLENKVYPIGDGEIPAETIGQRLKENKSYNNDTVWNGEPIPALTP